MILNNKVTVVKNNKTSNIENTCSYKFKNFIKLNIIKSKSIANVETDKPVKDQNILFLFEMRLSIVPLKRLIIPSKRLEENQENVKK